MEDSRLHLANQWARFTNSIIDLFSIFFLCGLLIVGLILLGFDKDETIGLSIIIVPIFWGYYLLTEFYFQRTLGKAITKTKVVTLTGNKPGFMQILVRTLGRSIPFEYLSYLGTATGIHDRLSGTRVI